MEQYLQAYKQLQAEKLRRLKYELYRRKPFEWVADVFGEPEISYKWSLHPEYKDHVWDGDADPLYNAWMDVSKQNWVAIQAATGTGKTYMIARLILWFLDVYDNSLVVTTAPVSSQLEKNLWAEISNEMEKFKKVRPYTRFTHLDIKPEGDNPSTHVLSKKSHQAIGFVAQVGTAEQSATKAQGFHRKDMLIVCDEAAGISSAIMTAFQNTCTGANNVIIAVGNPDSEYDELNQFSLLTNVKSYRISAFDHPNVVKKSEVVSGAVTIPSIDRRKEKYGEDSPLYLSRVRGIVPNEGEDSLIKRTWIDQCTVGHKDFCAEIIEGHSAVGIDVSNSETGDKASTVFGKGNVVDSVQEFHCPNANHLAWNMYYTDDELWDMDIARQEQGRDDKQKIHIFGIPKLKDYGVHESYIGIDSVGVGVGTLNAFLDLGITAVGLSGKQWSEVIPKDNEDKPLYEFISLRTQMYWEAREDIRNRKVVFDLSPEMMKQLKIELTIPKYKLSKLSIVVESKDDIKKRLKHKSPNVADAFVYWNWIRKGYRANMYTWMPVSAGE